MYRLFSFSGRLLENALDQRKRRRRPPYRRKRRRGYWRRQLFAWLADEYPKAQLTGIDLSPEQVARSKRRTAMHGDRVRVIQGLALELPFDSSSFDTVISVASLKHWPNPMQGMREIVRVLRPGGFFYVVEVDRGCKLEDASRFVDAWLLPLPARRLALPLFRTFVAGVGVDLEDARQILRDLGLPEAGARRVPGTPGILIEGPKKV